MLETLQIHRLAIVGQSIIKSQGIISPSFRVLHSSKFPSWFYQAPHPFCRGFSSGAFLNRENEKNRLSISQAGDVHFKISQEVHPLENENVNKPFKHFWDNPIPHAVYKESDLVVEKTHHTPKKTSDRLALFAVKCMRGGFDFASRYKGPGGEMTKRDWINRCLFLETVAGVPGMVAGMCRHLKSLRSMKRDYGWIHTLLEEAENERMHLLIFMKMKDPGLMFRTMVIGAQGIFFNMFFLTYLFSPGTCHRFVGYLEEEAVKTYTGLLDDLEGPAEHLKTWRDEPAPEIAINYYKLSPDATVKDVVQCIRADEAHHRDVNHTFAGLDYEMDPNPFLQNRILKQESTK